MPSVVFADEQEDIASLRTKLEGVAESDVAVVVPRENRSLVSPVAIRLLQRQAETLALDVSLVSANPDLRRIASEEGLRVFGSPRAFERAAEQGPGLSGYLGGVVGRLSGQAAAAAATALVLGVVGLAVGLVYVFLPSATVTITPRAEVVSGTVPIVADPAIRAVDAKAGRIPARAVYLLVEVSDQTTPGQASGQDAGHAVGIVTLTNRNSQEMVVPKGTIVATPDGIQFRTDAEVKLAGGLGNTGRVRAVAVNAGPASNVGRIRIDHVEGLLQFYVTAQNEEPMAGGGASATPVITADDQDRLQGQAFGRAKQDGLARLQALPRGREVLIPESVEFTPLDVAFDHEIGQEAKALSIHLQVRAAATLVDQGDVEEAVRGVWQPTPRPGFAVAPDGVRLQSPEVTRVDGRVVTLAAHVQATTLAAVNVARVQQYARWRDPAEVAPELARVFDLPKTPTIALAPDWAQRAYRVRVVVDTSTAPPAPAP